MHPTRPDDYSPIPEIELPDTPVYRLVGFDAGADFFDVTPDDALSQIFDRGRSPLTIDEGIAVLLHAPDVLAADRLLAARLAARRPPRPGALAERRQAEARLVLGRRAALVARRRLMPRADRLRRRGAYGARPGRCARP